MTHKAILLISFIFIISCHQVKKDKEIINEEIKTPKIEFVKTIPITGVVELAFAKIDTIFNLYQEPYIIVGENVYPIKGYHSIHSSRDQIIGLSPDGRYFMMDSILGKEQDNACVVVDLLHKRVVQQLQNGCDGEWNAQNQWISNGQIILSFD